MGVRWIEVILDYHSENQTLKRVVLLDFTQEYPITVTDETDAQHPQLNQNHMTIVPVNIHDLALDNRPRDEQLPVIE